ncbi:ABC-F family ATP-binding cassette domain-containing protein [Jeotgalibacillus aurantiacus]|uniref:ABC-F family ATP-binding cassette domain-containing protein n=1 Tax=Jeotgalibacillus aurantiacus TaxID=2763266 RepID=UPI001D0BA025|nr:ABC-F family ATP-binding cassette domain-containing protein [Jeotgalibacillus aurantiacus]
MKQCRLIDLTKTYGDKALFHDLNLTITEGEKIGLIGVNGTGKSTLLSLISGIELPDSGTIDQPKDFTVRLLDQEPELDDGLSILETVFKTDAKVVQLMNRFETALAAYEKNPESAEIQEKFMAIQQKMEEEEAWDATSQAKTILSKLGIHDTNRQINELSGGQKKRVALAQVMLETPDLLLLDEPTNHLDYQAIDWLAGYLKKYKGALMVVSHDRYFLDEVSTVMVELENGKAYQYKGNYESFIEAKALREEQEQAEQQKHNNLYRSELAWMRKGAKARTTKQKARIKRFEELDKKTGPVNQEDLTISAVGSRLGKQVVELKNVAKAFNGKSILTDFDFMLLPGDRIGIAGPNGSGKSTLMDLISGRIEPDSGSVIIGQTVKFAYFSQEIKGMNEQLRMIEYLREEAEEAVTKEGKVSVSQMLEQFLFPPSVHGTPIYKLSGGEKKRLYLLRLLMQQPNVLLLDEPTNDLDTQTLTVLENFIESFEGVVITVSHDRYFLDKSAEKLIILGHDQEPEIVFDRYSDYLAAKTDEKPEQAVKETKKEKPKQREKKRLSFHEKKEWEEIDDKIAAAELKIESLEQELNQTGSDFTRADEIMSELEKTNDELEHLIERWSYLSEIAEQAD